MDVADGQMGIYARQKDIVLGFDPGRDKTGFAFVDEGGGLIMSGIFATNELDKFFGSASSFAVEGHADDDIFTRVSLVVVGNGTHSRDFTEQLRPRVTVELITADERNTTLEARSLYWQLHRPNILMRLLPEGLRVPGRVLDDLAAWSIARRGIKEYRDIRRNKL